MQQVADWLEKLGISESRRLPLKAIDPATEPSIVPTEPPQSLWRSPPAPRASMPVSNAVPSRTDFSDLPAQRRIDMAGPSWPLSHAVAPPRKVAS